MNIAELEYLVNQHEEMLIELERESTKTLQQLLDAISQFSIVISLINQRLDDLTDSVDSLRGRIENLELRAKLWN